MPDLSRSQLLVYGALACVALLLGARWIRASEGVEEPAGGGAFASGSAAGTTPGGGTFAATDGDLVVHVAGEVARPGVYRMPAGSRVTDAIERAGGLDRNAEPDAINLAAKLADGQQVVIPAAAALGAGGASGVGAAGGSEGPISLGTATVEQLDTIEGIGPVTAGDIIEFRDQNGGVGSVDDLDQISGIGPATMEALRASLQP